MVVYMGESTKHPFKPLGGRLKALRQRRHESLAEVSGAIEIDIDALQRIEDGAELPNEETLLLLMTHFGLKEEEAQKLWKLAGYDKDRTTQEYLEQKPYVMVAPIDNRIIYTDTVHVAVNNYGVIINFMQGMGPNGQPVAVSRLGMSREHAESLLQVLRATLDQSNKTPKSLPAP